MKYVTVVFQDHTHTGCYEEHRENAYIREGNATRIHTLNVGPTGPSRDLRK